MEKKYFIGRLEVNEETYQAYKKDKLTWQIFHFGIFWFGCFICTLLAMIFWVKVAGGEETIYRNAYIEACKDFYSGKTKADLVENADGTREWKWREK